MPKGAVETSGAMTTATRLREQIRELEIGFANLRGRGDAVFDLLTLRDEVGAAIERFEQSGTDMRAERTRVETVDNIISRRAPEISRELARMGGLEGARRRQQPPEEHWWWYVDLCHAEKRRKSITRTLITIASIIVIVLAGNYILDRYFGLDPVEKEARSFMSAGDQLLLHGDVEGAIAEYEQAVTVLPDLGDAHVTLGVLYDVADREADAEDAFAAARAAYDDDLTYYLALGRAYAQVEAYDEAMAAIESALAIDPESPEAYLTRGGIYEATEEYGRALEDFELAGTLAQERQQDALYVVARTRMAMLMQRSPAFGTSLGP